MILQRETFVKKGFLLRGALVVLACMSTIHAAQRSMYFLPEKSQENNKLPEKSQTKNVVPEKSQTKNVAPENDNIVYLFDQESKPLNVPKQESQQVQNPFDNLRTWTEYCFKNLKEYFDASSMTYLLKDNKPNPEIFNISGNNLTFLQKDHPFNNNSKIITDIIAEVLKDIKDSLVGKDLWEVSPNDINALDQSFIEKRNIKEGSKIIVIGDIHGSIHSLLRLLWDLVAAGYLDENFTIKKVDTNLVFLGDFVDRGCYSIEVLYTILRLKKHNKDHVIILSGNHEMPGEDGEGYREDNGFYYEIKGKFDKDDANKVKKACQDFFCYLPAGLFVTCGDYVVQFCHGGTMLHDNKQKDYGNKIDITAPGKNWRTKKPLCYQLVGDAIAHDLRSNDFQEKNKKEDAYEDGRGWKVFYADSSNKDKKFGIKSVLDAQNISAIFRGHQHNGSGLKFLTPNGLEPMSYLPKDIINKTKVHYEKELAKSDWFDKKTEAPVYTFTTAVHAMSLYDCMGILTIKKRWDKCRFHYWERPIRKADVKKNGYYCRLCTIVSSKKTIIQPEWTENADPAPLKDVDVK
jgi:hypothetical protein